MSKQTWLRSTFAVLLASAFATLVEGPAALAAAETPQVHAGVGVIRAFGAERRSVVIAHEPIPRFMGAMTMSFDAQSAAQLKALGVGDTVAFTFILTSDGRRELQKIEKARR